MIKDLIVRLMEEANEEAEHKGWCDTELSTNEQTREAKKKQAKDLEKEWKQLAKELEVWEESAKKSDTVEQLLTEEDFREVCGSKTCVVGFLPHIYDDQAKGRNENIK